MFSGGLRLPGLDYAPFSLREGERAAPLLRYFTSEIFRHTPFFPGNLHPHRILLLLCYNILLWCEYVCFTLLSFGSDSPVDGYRACFVYRTGRALGGGIAMIILNQLVAGYERQPVTSPLTGTLERGSMTAIIGANGCGKSTLLKTLAGFLPPG